MIVSAGYGMMCQKCNLTIDIFGAAGGDASKCPKCQGNMAPNKAAKISANVHCNRCNSSFGIINSDKCPTCGNPF